MNTLTEKQEQGILQIFKDNVHKVVIDNTSDTMSLIKDDVKISIQYFPKSLDESHCKISLGNVLVKNSNDIAREIYTYVRDKHISIAEKLHETQFNNSLKKLGL